MSSSLNTVSAWDTTIPPPAGDDPLAAFAVMRRKLLKHRGNVTPHDSLHLFLLSPSPSSRTHMISQQILQLRQATEPQCIILYTVDQLQQHPSAASSSLFNQQQQSQKQQAQASSPCSTSATSAPPAAAPAAPSFAQPHHAAHPARARAHSHRLGASPSLRCTPPSADD